MRSRLKRSGGDGIHAVLNCAAYDLPPTLAHLRVLIVAVIGALPAAALNSTLPDRTA